MHVCSAGLPTRCLAPRIRVLPAQGHLLVADDELRHVLFVLRCFGGAGAVPGPHRRAGALAAVEEGRRVLDRQRACGLLLSKSKRCLLGYFAPLLSRTGRGGRAAPTRRRVARSLPH